MDAPTRAAVALPMVVAAHRSLLADLVVERDPAAPSALDGWSLGHLLTHLARNADSVIRRLEGARDGLDVEQYPGGAATRVAEIERGAGRPWAVLVADVAETASALEVLATELPRDAWGSMSTSVSGVRQDAALVLERRVREVVIHHTDLGLGFTSAQWPDELVAELVDKTVAGLAQRAEHRALVGWLTGRGPAPSLTPWI